MSRRQGISRLRNPQLGGLTRLQVIQGSASLVVILSAWLMGGVGLKAHDAFVEVVHHRIRVTAKENHLELSYELTLFEKASQRERRVMDVNGDGRIVRRELDAYVRALDARLTNAPGVFLGDKALRVVELIEPQVDLLGDEGVGWAHHRLVLKYFVPNVAELTVGEVLRVEDPFWSSWPAIVVVQGAAVEDKAWMLQPEAPGGPVQHGLGPGEKRICRLAVEAREARTLVEASSAKRGKEDHAH